MLGLLSDAQLETVIYAGQAHVDRRTRRRDPAPGHRREGIVMTRGADKRGFATRPADPDGWIKAGDAPPARDGIAAPYSARLTVDITPELRGRIKIAAFKRGITVAEMLRDLLAREFADASGERP